MIPADFAGQVVEHGIRLDDGRASALGPRGHAPHHVADLERGEGRGHVSPELERGGGVGSRRAFDGHVDDRVVGIHPEADGRGGD